MINAATNPVDMQDDPDRRGKMRPQVDMACEIKVASHAWRKTAIADLTPGGFQVKILEMPPRGTPVSVRIAGLQMLQAEVCWTKLDTAGCRFLTPLSEYVYDHILAHARAR